MLSTSHDTAAWRNNPNPAENGYIVWEFIYDKYAPAMYGIIYNLTGDKFMAENFLIGSFLLVKEKDPPLKIDPAFCTYLMRYAYNFTIQQLKKHGITPKEITPVTNKLLHLLCTQCSCLKEVASLLNITEEEAKQQLRLEFIGLRNQHKKEMV